MKKCSKCGGPQDCNHRYCRNCKAAYARDWRRTHVQTLEEKRKDDCRAATRYAVRYDRLRVAPCYVCGTSEGIEGHHENYSDPFTVVWLCANHHDLVTQCRLCLIGTLQQKIGVYNLNRPKSKQLKFPVPPRADVVVAPGITMKYWEANDPSRLTFHAEHSVDLERL